MELISNKSDELSLKVYGRVSTCFDLPAVEARCHTACRKKFDIFSISSPSGSGRERPTNAEAETLRIVRAAAKLIITELKSTKFNMTNYQSNEMIKDVEYNKAWLPELLRTLLKSLINNSLRQASIGQSIAYAVRPRSVLPPILFGSGIELDHVFGSRWLLTEQNHLGYCLNPDEVLRYKQSVVMNETTDDLFSVKQGSFGQWSTDNVDHNARTIAGNSSLHAMGIIVSTTGG